MVSAVFLLAATLLATERNGMSLAVEADRTTIDPGRSVFVTVTLTVPTGIKAQMPDFRSRVRGFSLAEDFAEEPVVEKDGSTRFVTNWKLVPEPCAEAYKIAPFVVMASPTLLARPSDDGKYAFWAGPVYFENPPARDGVTGDMECDPKKDLPPFSWKLAGEIAAALLAVLVVLALLVLLVRFLSRKIREHRMSPIERARVELDRLLRKGLPGRGRYKDFYVELTMVVRRYIQRKYGIRAPHLTTEEFLRLVNHSTGNRPLAAFAPRLAAFLENADRVKFAGVQATPEMADEATDSARRYLDQDAAAPSTPSTP